MAMNEPQKLLARKREKYNETRPVNWPPLAYGLGIAVLLAANAVAWFFCR